MCTDRRNGRKVFTAAVIAMSLFASISISGCGPKVAATVGGQKILASTVDSQIEQMRKQHPNIFEGAKGKQLEQQFRSRIIDNLVTNVLVLQEAKAQGITVSEQQVDAKIAQMGQGFKTQAQFAAALASSGSTLEGLRERIRTQLVTQRMVDKITAAATVTATDAQDYYRVNRELFLTPASYHVLAIKLNKNQFALARNLIAKINAGADFGAVSLANSVDNALTARNGDLGDITVDRLPQAIQPAAESAPLKKVVGPIVGSDAIWVIKVLSRTPAHQKTFAEAKSRIYSIVMQEKQVKAFNDWLAGLKKKAKLQTTP